MRSSVPALVRNGFVCLLALAAVAGCSKKVTAPNSRPVPEGQAEAVSASIPTNTTLPVLSNVLLEATHDGLRLSGTDLDIAVSTMVPASVDQEGAITFPAKKLSDIVRELPSAGVRLTTSGEQRATIECGRAKFKLLGLSREEFPAFPAVKFEGGWRSKAGELQKLVSHVAFAASTEESRPILNGVLWELRADRMRMVATNGHRLARMDVWRWRRRQRSLTVQEHRRCRWRKKNTPWICSQHKLSYNKKLRLMP